MKDAIQKAIEGGYEAPYSWEDDSWQGEYGKLKTLIDTLFWQALGKQQGWDESKDNSFYIPERQWNYPVWKKRWHYFIDHLAEGKDVEEFFTNLLK